MANEVFTKVACHNVVCCIHAAHEIGITPVFGKSDSHDSGEYEGVIPFPKWMTQG